MQLAKTNGSTIYEFDEAEQVFVPRANYGVSSELVEVLRQSRLRVGGETIIGRGAAHRVPMQVPDAS